MSGAKEIYSPVCGLEEQSRFMKSVMIYSFFYSACQKIASEIPASAASAIVIF